MVREQLGPSCPVWSVCIGILVDATTSINPTTPHTGVGVPSVGFGAQERSSTPYNLTPHSSCKARDLAAPKCRYRVESDTPSVGPPLGRQDRQIRAAYQPLASFLEERPMGGRPRDQQASTDASPTTVQLVDRQQFVTTEQLIHLNMRGAYVLISL